MTRKWNYPRWIVVLLVTIHCQVHAALSETDHDKLTLALQTLSAGWNAAAVNEAFPILCNPVYNRDDWNLFFTEYFSSNPLTNELWRDFLYPNPVFHFCIEESQQNLQEGMVQPLLNLIETIMSSHTPNLGQALQADENLRDSLFNAHDFMATLGDTEWLNLAKISDQTRRNIYDFYIDHIETYPTYLKKRSTVDTAANPYVGALRAQIHLNLRNFLLFDNTLKNQIGTVLDLSGKYLTLWNNHSLLILDNNGLDDDQLNVIDNFLSELPNGIHKLTGITQNDSLGNTGTTYIPVKNYGIVNVFDIPVGAIRENGFPGDVSAKYSDVFSLVLAHELNHMVDAYTIHINPRLASRRSDLVASAGCNAMNYLRSMFPDCFFAKFPQEFFASIANQWFSSSIHTLELALTRLASGHTDPINQFLFFADVYSQGGDTTYFYELDTNGNITRQAVPIERNSKGNISTLTIARGKYVVSYNAAGYANEAYLIQAYLPGDLDADGDIDTEDFYNILLPAFGSCEADSNYYRAADLDNDNCVTFTDYQIWYGYYVANPTTE